MQAEDFVSRHYERADLGGAILAALRAAGKDPDRITPDDLAPVDHFHIGGRASTRMLMQLAGFEARMSVLDVGGGIGGPARRCSRKRVSARSPGTT